MKNEQDNEPNQRTLLFGFGAFLASRKEPITCSSTHEVGPLFAAIEEYCQLRDIDPNYGRLQP